MAALHGLLLHDACIHAAFSRVVAHQRASALTIPLASKHAQRPPKRDLGPLTCAVLHPPARLHPPPSPKHVPVGPASLGRVAAIPVPFHSRPRPGETGSRNLLRGQRRPSDALLPFPSPPALSHQTTTFPPRPVESPPLHCATTTTPVPLLVDSWTLPAMCSLVDCAAERLPPRHAPPQNPKSVHHVVKVSAQMPASA